MAELTAYQKKELARIKNLVPPEKALRVKILDEDHIWSAIVDLGQDEIPALTQYLKEVEAAAND